MNRLPETAHGLTSKPRKGDRIGWPDESGAIRYAGTVTSTEGNLCWLLYPDGDTTPFIWQHRGGLNRLATLIDDDKNS